MVVDAKPFSHILNKRIKVKQRSLKVLNNNDKNTPKDRRREYTSPHLRCICLNATAHHTRYARKRRQASKIRQDPETE